MQDVSTILLDKTGTITERKPGVTDLVPLAVTSVDELLMIAASAESGSEHPLGQAMVEKAREKELKLTEATDFEAVTGKGIRTSVDGVTVLVGSKKLMIQEGAIVDDEVDSRMSELEKQAKTAMLVARDHKVIGIIAVADRIKEDSKKAIAAFREFGLTPIMMTGDNERTARAIAAEVGIEEVLAGVMPDQKSDKVRELQNSGEKVAMVGDGINDAPALTQADVGIAVGTGTDVAIESGDIVLVKGDLSAVVKAIKLSRATFTKIKQNLFWAFFYNLVMIPLGIIGRLRALITELARAFSSNNVVGNSRRLRKKNIQPEY
jgi:Cu+-exporting ATPase